MSKTQFFLAADGDNIGKTIEQLLILNDTQGLKDFSELLTNGLKSFVEDLQKIDHSKNILFGGDSVIFQFTKIHNFSEFISKLEQVQLKFNIFTKKNITIVLAKSLNELFVTMKYAKSVKENLIVEMVDNRGFKIHFGL